jgi:hypothetical protein
MTVEAIKDLIEELPPEDQTALALWISERDSRAWDEQIERDFSPGGAGMTLLDEIDAHIDAGDIEGFRVIRPRE